MNRFLVAMACFLAGAVRGELVGYWNFDQLSLAEVSGFRAAGVHDGKELGTVRYSDDVPPGFTGYSLDFPDADGVNGFVVKASGSADPGYQDTFDYHLWKAGQFTLAAWVKSGKLWPGPNEENDQHAAFNGIISKFRAPAKLGTNGSTETGRGYFLRRDRFSKKVMFSVNDGRTVADMRTTRDVLDGAWHHVAVTHDGQVCRLYVDGREEAMVPNPIVGTEPE